MKLRSIIVDDSSMQRMAVANLVNNHPDLVMISGYSNAIEAKNGIKNHEIDLIFLDVEMPIINGFDLLESLDNPPQVILITGNPGYALKAFDYDVTDYLRKPITLTRFDASIKKAVSKYEQMRRVNDDEEYIFVKSSLKKHKVVINNIKWIEGLGDYIKLVTNEGNIVILSTMKSFEKQLPEDKFLRIHKSYIVNLEKIEKFDRKNVEVGGQQVPVSRRKKIELMEALNNI